MALLLVLFCLGLLVVILAAASGSHSSYPAWRADELIRAAQSKILVRELASAQALLLQALQLTRACALHKLTVEALYLYAQVRQIEGDLEGAIAALEVAVLYIDAWNPGNQNFPRLVQSTLSELQSRVKDQSNPKTRD